MTSIALVIVQFGAELTFNNPLSVCEKYVYKILNTLPVAPLGLMRSSYAGKSVNSSMISDFILSRTFSYRAICFASSSPVMQGFHQQAHFRSFISSHCCRKIPPPFDIMYSGNLRGQDKVQHLPLEMNDRNRQ